jgi:hypothetical protein
MITFEKYIVTPINGYTSEHFHKGITLLEYTFIKILSHQPTHSNPKIVMATAKDALRVLWEENIKLGEEISKQHKQYNPEL